jgi:iron only hydrogenase large subunit-like protein
MWLHNNPSFTQSYLRIVHPNPPKNMSNFSSAIILSDLNDFISPTLECIKPVEGVEIQKENEIQVEKDGEKVLKNGEKVEINLTDCLACSGCITSAESVLISIQSNKEFYRILEERSAGTQSGSTYKLIVVSISSQSRASLANKWGISKDDIWILLNKLFVAMGVDYVFDIDFARDISLLASGCEFVSRFTRDDNLPVLASSCPGWVCYAEKYVADFHIDAYLLLKPNDSFFFKSNHVH